MKKNREDKLLNGSPIRNAFTVLAVTAWVVTLLIPACSDEWILPWLASFIAAVGLSLAAFAYDRI